MNTGAATVASEIIWSVATRFRRNHCDLLNNWRRDMNSVCRRTAVRAVTAFVGI